MLGSEIWGKHLAYVIFLFTKFCYKYYKFSNFKKIFICKQICGWFNFLGNVAGDAAFAYGFSKFISSLIFFYTDGSIKWSVGEEVALSIGSCAVWAVKNYFKVEH